MKSLLDIQQEIRALENNVNSISKGIKSINTDIEKLRDTDSGEMIDYKRIEVLAKYIKFGEHPLSKSEDSHVCQIYIKMLLNIIRMDFESKDMMDRLVLIQWLQIQSGIDWSLQELLTDSYHSNTDMYCEFAELLTTQLSESFIVDALIVANMGGSAKQKIFEFIADICGVLGIEKERLKILSLIARVVLCQNPKCTKGKNMDDILKNTKDYTYYISADTVDKDISAQRDVVVQLCDTEVHDYKWEVKQMDKVEKGDVIATYRKSLNDSIFSHLAYGDKKEIKATSSGTIFQFKVRDINYGVISIEMDHKDSIKSWIKAKKSNSV